MRLVYQLTRGPAISREGILISSLVLLLIIPAPTAACSLVLCELPSHHEVRNDFTVFFEHEGRPLNGVHVRLKRIGGEETELVSGSDGRVRFSRVAPGEYSLDARLLGLSAGYYNCFHVAKHGGLFSKRSFRFTNWGAGALPVHSVSGHLGDLVPGQGPSQIWNVTHRIRVPIQLAALRLRNPITGMDIQTTSDTGGAFAFKAVPSGTYVLHIEKDKSGVEFDETDILIRVADQGPNYDLVLLKTASGCGGYYLEAIPQNE